MASRTAWEHLAMRTGLVHHIEIWGSQALSDAENLEGRLAFRRGAAIRESGGEDVFVRL